MHQYVNSFGHKEFSFPLKSLVEFMLEYHGTYGRHCTWFQSAGNIYSLVANFLRTKDCFIQHTQSHCSLEIYLSTSLQSIRCKEAYSGRPSLDSVASVPGQVLQITAEVLTSPYRLSYVMSADNKIGYLFEPPLLDQACHDVPQTIDVSSLTWQPRKVSVTVSRLFPGPVKFELAFRLKVEGKFDNTDGNRPLQQALVPNFSEAKPPSTQATFGRPDSLFNDVHGLDVSSSSHVYDGSTRRSHVCPQRLRCERHFFTDCVDAVSESISPLEDRSNRHFWTENACSQLERDAQDLYPRLYETYGDARIHKFSTLQPRKSFLDVQSYPCRCPHHNLHPIPMHASSWNRRHGNCATMGRYPPRLMSPRRSDDSDLVPQFDRHVAKRHAIFCSEDEEDMFWESSLSRPKKDISIDNDTAGVSSAPQPETPPNPNVPPSTPSQSDRAQEVISMSEKANDIQEPSLEGNTPETVSPHAADRFDGCGDEPRCKPDESSLSAPAPAENGQQNAADPLRGGADSIKIPGKTVISEPFINTVLVDTPQTCLPMRFEIRDLQKRCQPNVNAKMGLHLYVDTSAKISETYHCLSHSENRRHDTSSLNESSSSHVINHRESVSSLTSPQWRAPRKTYRLQDHPADNRSKVTVRNLFDVLRSPDLSTITAASPTCESDIDDALRETKLDSAKHECLSTASRGLITKNVHGDSLMEKGKGKRSVEEIGNTDIEISSQASITSHTSDNFELEVDWDKYGTLGLTHPSGPSGTSDAHVSNLLDSDQPPSAMPETPDSGPSTTDLPASALSSRRTRLAACTPTPTRTLHKRRAFRYDTPQQVDDTCTTQRRAIADADAVQAQIQANFAEFLARAETMHPGKVIGAAQDLETNEFETIFIESPMSVGTVDIVVEETEEEERE